MTLDKNGKNALFDQIKNISHKNEIYDRGYIEQYYVGRFILLKWFSFFKNKVNVEQNEKIIQYINILNSNITFEEKYDEYLYLYHTLPKIKTGFLWKECEYIKKHKKKESDKKEDNLIKKVIHLLEISKKDAKLIIEKELINPKQFYG